MMTSNPFDAHSMKYSASSRSASFGHVLCPQKLAHCGVSVGSHLKTPFRVMLIGPWGENACMGDQPPWQARACLPSRAESHALLRAASPTIVSRQEVESADKAHRAEPLRLFDRGNKELRRVLARSIGHDDVQDSLTQVGRDV